jgi:hypothetical protein
LGRGAVLGVAILAFVVWTPSPAPLPELRITVLPFDSTIPPSPNLRRSQENVPAELVRDGRFSVVSSSQHAPYPHLGAAREVSAALAADVLIQLAFSSTASTSWWRRAVNGELRKALGPGFAGTAADSDALERAIAGAIADKFSHLGVEKRQ